MKTTLLFLALTALAFGADAPQKAPAGNSITVTPGPLSVTVPACTHLTLVLANGECIDIDCQTGKVTLPKDMTTDRASREFWFALPNNFAEVRAEWLATQAAKP